MIRVDLGRVWCAALLASCSVACTVSKASTRPERPGSSAARIEWVGVLSLSKGEQPAIRDRILVRDDVERLLGVNWREQLGHRVRASGVLQDRPCDGPQCTTGGAVPLLVNLSALAPCRASLKMSERAGADCGAVAPAEVEACTAECDRLEAPCNRSAAHDRGALRRCGCARVSCMSGCRSSGEAEFVCF